MRLRADAAFWAALDQLLATKAIVIDRPRDSRHPRFPEMVYPLDYGYLAETRAADGGGVDVWRGSLADAGVVAVACTVDLYKCDTELKLIVGCTPHEIDLIEIFHNAYATMKAALIVRK
jgi:inorganic pyrophosphatase